MLWKKPSSMKYTDLCIYIDEHVPDILNPGEHPDIENTVYNYLWLTVKALAIKKHYFQSFSDYDGYAFYAANRLFFALRKNQWNTGKVIKGKQIRPIKSCLNYIKKLLYPMKIEYQQEAYKEIIDEEFVSKKFDAFTLKESLKSNVQQSQGQIIFQKAGAIDLLKSSGLILDQVLERLPFNKNSIDYKKIRISILLNCISSLKAKNKLGFNSASVILWKLPKSMSEYVKVLIKEFYTELEKELLEQFKDNTLNDQMLEKILSYKEGGDYNYED